MLDLSVVGIFPHVGLVQVGQPYCKSGFSSWQMPPFFVGEYLHIYLLIFQIYVV